MLEDLFSKKMWDPVNGHSFIHRIGFQELPRESDGAVVIIPGRFQAEHIDKLNADLATLRWALVIIVGDEESVFPSERIRHPNKKLWIQTPIPGRHDFADRFLIVGYPTDAPKMIGLNREGKLIDWFFSGQVTHERRRECTVQLQRIPGGYLNSTEGFTKGLDREKFYQLLSQAKIAPCPSGPQTPDTFRFAEALEAGCIPVADGLAPAFPARYWQYLFQEQILFPVVEDWGTLPELFERLLSQWPGNANSIFAWWQGKKREMAYNLRDDINFLIEKSLAKP